MPLSNPHFNHDKSLKLYKRKYTRPHKRAGKYNPVWRAKIKISRGIPAQDFSTSQRGPKEALKVAERRLDEMRAQHSVGMDISIKQFDEVARLMLNTLKQEHRQKTCSDEKLEKYRYDIEEVLNPHFGKMEIKKVSGEQIDRFFANRKNIQLRRNGRIKSYSASSLTKTCTTLRAVFREGVKRGYLSSLPHFPTFKVDQYIREGLTLDEWHTLQDYITTDFVRELDKAPTDQTLPKYYRQSFVDYFQFVVWTGLRRTEALKLRWQDWSTDIEDGVSIGRIHVRAIEKGARKTEKPRIFKVHDKVNLLLQERRTRADYTKDTDYIFCHPKIARKHLRRRNIKTMRNSFNKSMEACDLLYDNKGNKRTMYIGRHTNAHLSRQAGKPIDDIADDIGNLVSTAQRFYIGTNKGDRKGLPLDID